MRFAVKAVRERGHVSDADIRLSATPAFSDAQIVEIIAVVAENVFTTCSTWWLRPDIDFPVVRAGDSA